MTKAFVDYWKPIVDEDGDGDSIDFLTDYDYEPGDISEIEDPKQRHCSRRSRRFCAGEWYYYEDKEHLNGPMLMQVCCNAQ